MQVKGDNVRQSGDVAAHRNFPARGAGEWPVRLGFGLVVILLIVSGWVAWLQQQTPAQYLGPALAALDDQDRDLANIRKFFSQGISSYRDFMMNGRANAEDTFLAELRKERTGIMKSLNVLPAPGSKHYLNKQFENDLNEYWGTLEDVREYTPEQKAEKGFDYMHAEVMPARNLAQKSLKALSDAVEAERGALMARYNQRRERLKSNLYAALTSSLIAICLLTWINLRYRFVLRRESLQKYDEVARSRDDLEHLSGKLLKIQEEERRRLSRELHDGIGQTLTALRMEIHQVHLGAGSGTAAGERLDRARMLCEEAVHTVKDISLLLRPPLLDDLGLEPAIGWQADQFSRRTGIPCRFRSSGLQELLPDDVKTCVFRVVQEALNNCQKHASPTKVQILIEQLPETLVVRVEDDGVGFPLNDKNAPTRNVGLGILGMRERAAMLGGTLSLQSALGMGTQLKLSLPLAQMSASAITQNESAAPMPAIGPGR